MAVRTDGWSIDPRRWPLSFRVPALVVLLMFTISAVITDRVLARLDTSQSRHLNELTNAYLDGISSAILPHVLRDDVWETYDALKRAGKRYRGLDVSWTTVVDRDDRVIASSLPKRFTLQSRLTLEIGGAKPGGEGTTIAVAGDVARFRRTLVHQGRSLGAIYGEIEVARLIDERWEVLRALVITNAILTLALAGVGYFAVRTMLRPVGMLSSQMRAGLKGGVAMIPDTRLGSANSEFGQLFRTYNSLVAKVSERERLLKCLAEEERLASLGRLASGMAHEINNPLGGMLNAVDAMERYGERADVRMRSIDLLRRGLKGIRGVVRSALATYRKREEDRALRAGELDDLALLIAPQARRKQLELEWHNGLSEDFDAPAHPVRDAALNLLLNACSVSPPGSTVLFRAEANARELRITVADSGPGLPRDVSDYLNSRDGRTLPLEDHRGLGIWIVKKLLREIDGNVSAEKKQPKGTRIVLSIPASGYRVPPDQEYENVA